MYSGKSGCNLAKVDLFGKKWFNSGKSGYKRANMVAFAQSCCIRAKVIVFGKEWLYSCKSGSIRSKDVVFGQSCCT